jgi:hypothetical protein
MLQILEILAQHERDQNREYFAHTSDRKTSHGASAHRINARTATRLEINARTNFADSGEGHPGRHLGSTAGTMPNQKDF